MTNVDAIFQQAFADHKNGKLKEAAEGYQKVLSVEPSLTQINSARYGNFENN